MKPPQFTVRRLMLCVLLSACYFAGIMSRRAVVARLGASLQRSRHEIMDLQQQLAAAKLGAIGRQIDKELMEVMELKKRLESDLDLVRTVDKGSSVEQGL